MLEGRQPTIDAALDRDERFDVAYVEGRANPSQMEPEARELMEIGRDELRRVEEQYDVPFDVNDVHIVVVDEIAGANASTTPIGCGVYTSLCGEWTVEEQPSEYCIFLPMEKSYRPVDDHRVSVRHECAHIADWHNNLRTTEQTETHAEWLRRLDAV